MIRSSINRLLLAGVLITAFLLPPPLCADEPADRKEEEARRNLQVLGQALDRYMRYNEGKLPTRMSELHEEGFVLDLDTFVSPASGARIDSAKQIDEKTDYHLTTNPLKEKPLLLLKEKKGFHGGKALAYYSDRKLRMEDPGFPPKLLETPAVVVKPEPPQPTEPARTLDVKVLGIVDKAVSLAPHPDFAPAVGDAVEFFFIIAEPDNLALIGSGKVSEVKEDAIVATLEKATGKVVKGSLARIQATKPQKKVKLGEYAGEWEVDDPDASYRLKLRQEGNRVIGSYGAGGVVTAEVREAKLHLTWTQKDRKRGGTAKLALSADGKMLSGSWQHDPRAFDSGLTGEGVWRFRRVAERTTTEPMPPTGDKVKVPLVCELSAKDARAVLKDAGLVAEFIQGETAPASAKPYGVYKQAPLPGVLVPKGTTVQLTVYAPVEEKP